MRVLCVGEMLVDIIVRPVEQVLLQNDTQLVREIRFPVAVMLTTMPSIWRDWATK